MKNKLFTLIIILSINLMGVAQEDDNKGKYTELLNDPYKIPNVEIMISPFWMSMSQSNLMQGGWSAGTNISFGKIIQLDANYATTYTKKYLNINYPGGLFSTRKAINLDYQHKNNSSYSVSQDLKRNFQFDAGISFVFNDKERISKDRVTLHQSQYTTGNMNVINATVTYVDTKIRKRWLGRLGFQMTNSILELSNLTDMMDDENYYMDDEGNRLYFRGIKYADVAYDESEYDPIYGPIMTDASDELYAEINGWVTNISTKTVAIGFSREVIRNLVIDVDDFGKRGNQKISKFYFDVLIAKVDVDDIVFFNSNPEGIETGEEMGTEIRNYKIAGTGEHRLETNPLGFRVGYETHGISPTKIIPWAEQDEYTRFVNMGYKTELGWNPGIKGKGFYFNMGIFFVINGKT